MKSFSVAMMAFVLFFIALDAGARDTRHKFPVADAIELGKEKGKIDGTVRFYFGSQKHPAIAKSFGEFQSNKKTNAFNKSDKYACEWAFLSAMISFQERARTEGGNAVVNIRSYYKKNEVSSETEYECGAGGILAGVTFKGEVVKLAN